METVLSSIEDEVDKIEDQVEQALYYSRIDSFSKDYFINEIDLPEGSVRIYYDRMHKRCIDVLMRREWQRNAL
jgi:signal transduction histidine kinase